MKQKSKKYLKYISRNNTFLLGKTFLKWLLIGSLIGIFIGGVIAIFLKSLEWATDYRVNHGFVLFLLPIGGALVSFLYYKFGRNSVKGNNLIIENINNYCGDVPLRMVPLVFFGTVVTHFFGGSAGREGTGVQIGASIAETIGKLLKLNKEDSKIMLMAGVSGGFSAIFGTPLAGTIFGLEVSILGKMSIVILLVYLVGSRKYLGLSLPLLSEAFNGHVSPFDFLGKLIFTSITLGAGYQGGEVTPLFVIGSTLGNTLSGILNLPPSFLASLGLVGVFAGATNTPIASFVLGIEMFGVGGAPYLWRAQ